MDDYQYSRQTSSTFRPHSTFPTTNRSSKDPTSASSSSSQSNKSNSFTSASPTTSNTEDNISTHSSGSTASKRKGGAIGVFDLMKGPFKSSSANASPTNLVASQEGLPRPVQTASSGISPSSPLVPLPRSSPSLGALPSTAFCTVTCDHESLSVVLLGGLTSPAAAKEKILTKLHIEDDDFFGCTFSLTRIGGGDGRLIDDDELWDICHRSREELAGVIIFVKLSSQSYNSEPPFIAQSAQSLRYGKSSPSGTTGPTSPHPLSSLPRSKGSPSAQSDYPRNGDDPEYATTSTSRDAIPNSSPSLKSDKWGYPPATTARGSIERTNRPGRSMSPGERTPARTRDISGTATSPVMGMSAADEYSRARMSASAIEREEHQERLARSDAAASRRAASAMSGLPHYSPPIGTGTASNNRLPVPSQTPQSAPSPSSAAIDYRAHPQFTSIPSSQYHNLYMQGQYQTPPLPPPQSLPYPSRSPNLAPQTFPSQSRSPKMSSQSTDNFRGNYANDGRQLGPALVHYRAQDASSQSPAPSRAPLQPQQAMYPTYQQQQQQQQPLGRRESQPSMVQYAPTSAYRSPGPGLSMPQAPPMQQQPVYASFDPRVMRPAPSGAHSADSVRRESFSTYSYAPPSTSPAPSLPTAQRRAASPNREQFRSPPQPNQLQYPPRRPSAQELPPMRSNQQQQQQQPLHHITPHDRSYDNYPLQPPSVPRLPNLSGHILLRPGETLQQVVRRPSDVIPEQLSVARPPVAAHMRVSDPSLARPSLFSDSNTMRRGSGEVMNEGQKDFRAERDRERERRMISEASSSATVKSGSANRPVSRGEREEGGFSSARSSGSSFTSLKSSPHVRRRSREEDDFGRRNSNTSTKSATSLLTPATERSSIGGGKGGPSISTPYGDFADDEEEEGAGTWLRQPTPIPTPSNNASPIETTSTQQHLVVTNSPVRQQAPMIPASILTPTSASPSTHGTDAGTILAGDWATFLINPFPAIDVRSDGEATFIIQDGTATPSIQLESVARIIPRSTPEAEMIEDESRFYQYDTSIESEFDGEEDGGTWFVPPKPSPDLNQDSTSTLVPETPSRSNSASKRPTLRLTIDSTPSSSASAPTQATIIDSGTATASAPEGEKVKIKPPTPNLSDLSPSFLTSPPIIRRASFAHREADSDWAFRPPVETVLEHLDEFFPEHDLDRPILDTGSPSSTVAPSPATPERAVVRQTSIVPLIVSSNAINDRVNTLTNGHLKYKKSIRKVALGRKKILSITGMKNSSEQEAEEAEYRAGLLRRKSTKLWGTRVEEVTPAQAKSMSTAIPDSLAEDDQQNFSFKWVKGELIGRGTYGYVYLALNVTNGDMLAVKQVELPKTRSDKDDARQQGMVASLKAEIELLKDLDHPKIVQYLGFEETITHLSIFLEYVPGGSVGRIVRKHGKFEEPIIKSFTAQILKGLRYLHGLGILHRDLKADNILCDHDGNCKISDFGTSKKSNDIYNNDANMSMQGSIFWMAPEVVQNWKKGYSAKADIWSLGCICLEMWAGRRPWSDEEAIQAMFKLGAERLAPPIPADVVLGESAAHFLQVCFKIDPDERPTATKLGRHIFLHLAEELDFNSTSLNQALVSSRIELANS